MQTRDYKGLEATAARTQITNVALLAQEHYSSFEDVRRRVPDIGKLAGLIGYRPRVSLEETLESIIADQRARLREHGVAIAAR
ncbi:MAG: hypothetical protein ACHP8B_04565 [Terriglobales bacterium]